ncbi:MAG: hypothetical protein CME26_10995 [Gemmatimonadetes bacterium]|nr:hypothetical protein [Gemmatimonadota bacterium]|tara:strand:- start:104 stop:535 length:432 start_codon:yes stop_codon:yes gene_type:complete
MNLPWKKKKSKEPITAKTALGAIRQLYNHYQKQANMWGYALLSSLVLVFLWIGYSVLREVNYTYLSLPLMGMLISAMQMYRIKGISNILRQAHTIQQQVDKAETEKKEQEEQASGEEASARNGPSRSAAVEKAAREEEEEDES